MAKGKKKNRGAQKPANVVKSDAPDNCPTGNEVPETTPEVVDVLTNKMESVVSLNDDSAAADVVSEASNKEVPSTSQIIGSTLESSSRREETYKSCKDVKLLWDSQENLKLGTAFRPHENHERLLESVGKKFDKMITVRANHFVTEIKKKSVYRYEVTVLVGPKLVQIKNAPLLYRVMEHLKKECEFDKFGVVFDGKTIILSATQLPIPLNFEKELTMQEYENDADSKILELKVKVNFLSEVALKQPVEKFLAGGWSKSNPLPQLQILNIILGYAAQVDFECSRREFFTENARIASFPGGKSLWEGTFMSNRISWKLELVVDVAHKAAYEEEPITKFIQKFLNLRPNDQLEHALADPKKFEQVSREIRGLKIRFTNPKKMKFDKRALGLKGPNAKEVTFPNNDLNKDESVFDYFKREHQTQINGKLPVLHVGNPQGFTFYPLEFVTLKRQVCPETKKLSDKQQQEMIKHTAVEPKQRSNKINECVGRISDPNGSFVRYQKGFGITVNSSFTEIRARVLKSPSLTYKNPRNMNPMKVEGGGKWRGKAFNEATSMTKWVIMNVAYAEQKAIDTFVVSLVKFAGERGVRVNKQAEIVPSSIDDCEETFKSIVEGKPQLVMVIVDGENTGVYPCIKYLGDLDFQTPTQFVQLRNVIKADRSTIENIILKLNMKLKGKNTILDKSCLPSALKSPVMIMGADVTHAAAFDVGQKPSIAAVMASCDLVASNYTTKVKIQERRPNTKADEMIQDLASITKQLLVNFFKKNNKMKPDRIFYFRDGVSEGQFREVLAVELRAIQEACKSLPGNYKPGITFVVVQKRHKTRLFPKEEKDGYGRMGNVPPGTVVDTVITHPTENDFFLVSQEGIKGTAKPTHYHPLYDDNNLTSDELQEITFYLCHLYSRCERSVSYPAPTYYAHLAAERARYHHNQLLMNLTAGKVTQDQYTTEVQKIENVRVVNHFM